jgi:hypothetical protein
MYASAVPSIRNEPAGHDREGQRDAASILVADVAVTAPPVDRMLGDPLEPETSLEKRGDDFAQCPGSGELPALVLVADGEPVDVFGRPTLRGLGAAEIVVVGRDPATVGVDIEQPFGGVPFEDHEATGRGKEAADDAGPGVEIVQP